MSKFQSAGDAGARAPQYPGDAISRRLDAVTLEEHMMRAVWHQPRDDPGFSVARRRRGLRPRTGRTLRLHRLRRRHVAPLDISDETGTQMFPDGNGGLARLITKTLIPESFAGRSLLRRRMPQCRELRGARSRRRAARIRLDSTAVWVEHDGDAAKSEFVTIAYTRSGKTHRVKARSVVMAGGSWTTRHIVRDLPADRVDAYASSIARPA